MRRVEGSMVVRGENKLLMSAELPRDRRGRFREQNGGAGGGIVVNSVVNSFHRGGGGSNGNNGNNNGNGGNGGNGGGSVDERQRMHEGGMVPPMSLQPPGPPGPPGLPGPPGPPVPPGPMPMLPPRQQHHGGISEAKRIDVISRVMFPLSFAGFNVMYWAYYLTKSYYSSTIPRNKI